MTTNGWVKIHRKLLKNPIATKASWAWLWIVLLLEANHEDKKFFFNDTLIDCKRGQLITGRDKLAKLAKIHRSSVERALKFFENEHQIEQQKTNRYRLITILNYDEYQKSDSKPSIQRASSEHPVSTNKNYKNYKNKKNTAKQSFAEDIVLLINAFKEVNPSYQKWFANTTQRAASERLIKVHTLQHVLQVIAILPKTNIMPYVPTITSPVQLEDKWASLESSLKRQKVEQLQKKPNIIL